MGQAIVYCAGCNAQLRNTDFEKGAAFKVDHKIYCKKCVPADFIPPSPEQPAPAKRHDISTARLRAVKAERQNVSTGRHRALKADSQQVSTGRHRAIKTERHNVTTATLKAIRAEPARPSLALIWAGGVLTGLVVVLIGANLLGGNAAPPAAAGPRVGGPAPSAPAPAAAIPPAEAAAQAAHARLLRLIADSPGDLERQQALVDELARLAPGTSAAPEVDREVARLAQRRKDRRVAELAELRREVQGSTEDQAGILLRAARQRYPDAAWAEGIDRLLLSVESKPPPIPAPAAAPAPAPAPAATPQPAPPAPPPSPTAPPASGFPAGWEAAMASATARDYPAALSALEKSPDLPLLKAVAALHRDAVQALSKTPRGQRVALGTVEGLFLRESGGIAEIKTDSGPVELEIGEIPAASLVALARTAGAVDPKIASAFCLIDGDAPGARTMIGADPAALPPRFWAYADLVARKPSEPSRELYFAALPLLARPATAAEGAGRLQALLRDRPDDLFVRRNRAALVTRSLAGRDFVFLAEDLRPSGLFRLAKGGKLETCYTCETDVEPAKQKETFLDVEFSTLADTPYRAWAWAGGCCQEVFDFSCQGTEMEAGKSTKESAEPGTAVAIQVRPYVSGLKKTHAQHTGPKQASRWEWVALPVPRYAKPGVQRIRIFSDEKGFSVAAVVVSANRTGPPSEAELKDAIHNRGERPKAAPPQTKAIPILTCAFDGTDQWLTGDLRGKSLYGVSLYGHSFTGIDRKDAVTFPEQGEMRFTYFLKTPSPITARIRVEKGGTTLPFDVSVSSPVVGTPTEVRIPFSSFSQAYVDRGPVLAPGDTARMFYVFSEATDCGFRLDSLSLVEIRK